MGSTAIHSHWELRECLTVEGVRWISYCYFTTHSVKKWGFSLGLILPTREVWKEERLLRSGYRLKTSLRHMFPAFCFKNLPCQGKLVSGAGQQHSPSGSEQGDLILLKGEEC